MSKEEFNKSMKEVMKNFNNMSTEEFNKSMEKLIDISIENMINKEEKEMNNQSTTVNTEEIKGGITMENLQAKLEKLYEVLANNAGVKAINTVLNAPASEVYTMTVEVSNAKIIELNANFKKNVNKINAIARAKASVEKTVAKMTSPTTEDGNKTVMAKVTAVAIMALKKVAALIKGVAKFTFDVAVILETLSARVVVTAIKETVQAGKEVAKSFNRNVIGAVKEEKIEEATKDAVENVTTEELHQVVETLTKKEIVNVPVVKEEKVSEETTTEEVVDIDAFEDCVVAFVVGELKFKEDTILASKSLKSIKSLMCNKFSDPSSESVLVRKQTSELCKSISKKDNMTVRMFASKLAVAVKENA